MNNPTPEPIDVAIVGGGVVGVAAACAVAARGRTTCLIERLPRPGLEASTHNSGVVHAGIYYPRDSLKALLCVEGRERLYAFCEEHGVPCERCGKLIVASDASEIGALESLAARGHANGVTDLEVVDRTFVRRREPHVEAAAAIWSPSTGVVEAEAFVRSPGARRRPRARWRCCPAPASTEAPSVPTASRYEPQAETILARRRGQRRRPAMPTRCRPRSGGEDFTIHPVRGDYAELIPSARHLVNGPVYPLPDPERTRSRSPSDADHVGQRHTGPHRPLPGAQGRLRVEPRAFGPLPRGGPPPAARTEARPTPSRRQRHPRPQAPAEQKFSDFLIRRDQRQPRLVHAAGIDSPGLTASLAIAERVADLVDETLR